MGFVRVGIVVLVCMWSTLASATPIATSNTSSLAFGNVEVGKASPGMTVTVTNTGTTNLTISSATITAGTVDYAVTAGTTGVQSTVIMPASSVSWTLACVPSTHGMRSGTFTITSNSNGTTGSTLPIAMSCIGQRGVLSLSSTTYNFAGVREGDTRMQTFTLTNSGNVAVSSIAYALDAKLLGFTVANVPTTLAAGSSVTITVTFAPANATDGCAVVTAGDCDIVFTGAWGTTPTTTTISLVVQGDGLNATYDTFPSPPNALEFGDLRYDSARTLQVSIINTGGSTLQIRSLTITPGTAISGELVVQSCTRNNTTIACPTMAAPYSSTGVNDTLVVNVTCDPANRVAMIDGSLTVTTDLGTANPNRTIPLKCNSTTAMLALTPSNMVLDFGATDLDATPVSVTKRITLQNTGTALLNLGTGTLGGAGLARFAFTSVAATPISPGAAFDVDVTYTPLIERPPNAPDVASLTFPINGVHGGPAAVAIQISGYGADRHIGIGAVPTFPDTYRNPGTAAPVRPLTVMNTGYAPLSLSAVMVSNDPVWTIINPDPVEVPAASSHDIQIAFAPRLMGAAPVGHLVIMNNDNGQPMVEVDLTGNGLSRQVAMGPGVINLGDTAVGVPLRLSDIAPSELLYVTSMDPATPFMIREIVLDGDAGFALETPEGLPATGIELPPNGTQGFDVVLTPDSDGTFETSATLYLDQDPEPHAVVTVRGRAARIGVHGGGGCSTGRGAGSGAVLVMVALASVLGPRRRRIVSVAVVAAASSPATADNIDTEMFRPTPATHAETFQLQSADVGASGEWALLTHFTFASNPLAIDATVGGEVIHSDRPVTRRAGFELGGAYAFLDRFEAGVRLPLYQQSGESGDASAYRVPDAQGTAFGDLGIHARARLLRNDMVSAAAALHLTLPTSTAGQYVGVDGPSVRVLGIASYRPASVVTLAANLGAVLRATSTYTNDAAIQIEQGSGLAWGIGASWRATPQLRVTGEVFGEVVAASDRMTGSLSPVEALGGVRYQFGDLLVGVAAGRGLTSALGSPEVRGIVSLAFTPSPDRPSLGSPAIVATPAPALAPTDRDRDGLVDASDTCPGEAEDKDGFQDGDGCVDTDNDGDAIADAQDKCPLKAEVINGVEDNDGCPDVADDDAIAVSGQLSANEAAEETFKKGRELMKEKKFAKACAAFEQSQRLDPQLGTQFNLAGCYVEVGKLATAWTMFRELGRIDKNPDRRAQANDAAAKLAVRVPKLRLTLSVTPAGLQVFMNSVNSNALIGLDTPVDFGTYEIVAGAPNFRPWRKTIEIKEEGKTTTVSIDLEQLTPAP